MAARHLLALVPWSSQSAGPSPSPSSDQRAADGVLEVQIAQSLHLWCSLVPHPVRPSSIGCTWSSAGSLLTLSPPSLSAAPNPDHRDALFGQTSQRLSSDLARPWSVSSLCRPRSAAIPDTPPLSQRPGRRTPASRLLAIPHRDQVQQRAFFSQQVRWNAWLEPSFMISR